MNVQTDQSDEEISGDNDGLSDNPQSSGPSQSLTSKTSIVQKFFDKSGLTTARCKKCKTNLTTKGGTTSTLRRHLQKKHPLDLASAIKEPQSKQKTLEECFSVAG